MQRRALLDQPALASEVAAQDRLWIAESRMYENEGVWVGSKAGVWVGSKAGKGGRQEDPPASPLRGYSIMNEAPGGGVIISFGTPFQRFGHWWKSLAELAR
jgi:hypothetical protein